MINNKGMNSISSLRQVLFDVEAKIMPTEFFPAKSREASDLIISDKSGYAFLMACCLDRGIKTEIIWSIPYEIGSRLGHLDPVRISELSMEELRSLFLSLDNKPRFINDAPRTTYEMTRMVVREYEGQACRIWEGQSVLEIKEVLTSIFGIGPGISNMTILLIEKAFSYRFKDSDRRRMDIKSDVHTKRVLHRLGICPNGSDKDVVTAARELNPECPAEMDGPLWWIGRTFCHPQEPHCQECPVGGYCDKLPEV